MIFEAAAISNRIQRLARRWTFNALMVLAFPVSFAMAQSAPAGLVLEVEGQAVFGASNFDAGVVPDSFFGVTGPHLKLDEGDGWGGAVALGYGWGNGWNAALRFRRLKADDSGGQADPGIYVFAAGANLLPGGYPIGALDARTEVESKTLMLDFEIGKDFAVASGHVQVFGGVTYASIERDVAVISDDCGCVPFSVLLANDFHGVGPKIGFRGGIPLNGTFSLVGGGSVAALIGTSKFASRLDDPLSPAYPFKTDDDRVVAALDGHVGISAAIGPGSLTLGYRIDAVLGALDTDQRVSSFATSMIGFPKVGDTHNDLIEHGPFARFALPLGGGAN